MKIYFLAQDCGRVPKFEQKLNGYIDKITQKLQQDHLYDWFEEMQEEVDFVEIQADALDKMLGARAQKVNLFCGESQEAINNANKMQALLLAKNPNLRTAIYEDYRLDADAKELFNSSNYKFKPSHIVPFLINKAFNGEAFSKVGTKNMFAEEIYNVLKTIISGDNYKDSIGVIMANPYLYKIMQNDKKIRQMCYFGDEVMLKSKASKSTQEIAYGEVKEIEIEMPREKGYDGEIETIAMRKLESQNH